MFSYSVTIQYFFTNAHSLVFIRKFSVDWELIVPKTLRTQMNLNLKEDEYDGDSVVLVPEEKEKSDELHFCYSYFWRHY